VKDDDDDDDDDDDADHLLHRLRFVQLSTAGGVHNISTLFCVVSSPE